MAFKDSLPQVPQEDSEITGDRHGICAPAVTPTEKEYLTSQSRELDFWSW